MTYMLGPCAIKGCPRHHGVTANRSSKRGPVRPFTGPFVSPLRTLAEVPTVPAGSTVTGRVWGEGLGEQAERSLADVVSPASAP